MPKITVSADDDHTELVGKTEAQEVHESDEHDGFVFEIVSGHVHVDHSKGLIKNARMVREGREGKWFPKGEPLYAAPAGDYDAVVDVRRASFNVEIFAPLTLPNVEEIVEILNMANLENIQNIEQMQNPDTLTSFAYDPGTGGADTLPANPVPDGIEVAVQANYGNADSIIVGEPGSCVIELKPGSTYYAKVSDTSAIGVEAVSAGDTVSVNFEG